MINIFKRLVLTTVVATLAMFIFAGNAHAATNGRMIDDAVFDDSTTMNVVDIQNFLNQFPNSCIKNYTDEMPSTDPMIAYFNYSGAGSVAQIIRRVSDLYGVNPRVLLTKLEQEENLVTGSQGCSQWRLASATGFHCFDGANPRTTVFKGNTIQTCVDTDANMGVARQLTKGIWTLKWGKERANGNLGWLVPDDGNITYYGPMTQGNRKRCASCATVYYDGYWNGVYVETGATASLYNYTPYLNQAFDDIWEGWFGSTITGRCIANTPVPSRVGVNFRKYDPRVDYGVFTIYQGSSTNCAESHVWSPGMTSWRDHIVSNLTNLNPDNNSIEYHDLNADGKDEPIAMSFRNTGSGKVEFHVWNYDMKSWIVHAVSNLDAFDPLNMTVQFGSFQPNRKKEPVAIGLQNTSSGYVEFHFWNPGLNSWRQHVITNLPAINPSNMIIRMADINGDGIDEMIAVGLRGTTSGKVEFHIWNPGLWSWQTHIVTNLAAIDPSNADIQFADLSGDGKDEAIVVQSQATGSGNIEFHIWNPGYYSWQAHIASNQPTP